MGIDPFSQPGTIVSSQRMSDNNFGKKRHIIVTILIVLILLFILLLSLFLIQTRTSFFNFASELTTTEDYSDVVLPSETPAVTTTIDTATSSATTVETSTKSAVIPVLATASPVSTPGAVAIDNSYMFASPLTAKTGNVEKIRVTIFILDGTGAGIPGKTVALTGVDKLAVYTIQGVTDVTGRAVFDVAAGTSGSYEIGASAGGVIISQKVTVTFD